MNGLLIVYNTFLPKRSFLPPCIILGRFDPVICGNIHNLILAPLIRTGDYSIRSYAMLPVPAPATLWRLLTLGSVREPEEEDEGLSGSEGRSAS